MADLSHLNREQLLLLRESLDRTASAAQSTAARQMYALWVSAERNSIEYALVTAPPAPDDWRAPSAGRLVEPPVRTPTPRALWGAV